VSLIAEMPKPPAPLHPMPRQPFRRRRTPLMLDIVRTQEDFLALNTWWDALVDQCEMRSPFLRWDYMCLWWSECRENDARLAVGVLRDAEGVPLAIAPLMLTSVRDAGRRCLRHLSFLAGLGHAHGERLDFIVPAGEEGELTPRLCRVFDLLRDECDTVRLNHLPEESPNTPHIRAALEEHFDRACVLNRHASRFIRLPASWEAYEKRHTSDWRSKLRRRCKAFIHEHAGSVALGGVDLTIQQSLDELHRLHLMQWPEGVSSFLTEVSWRFHQRLARRWMPDQHAVMPMLASDGRVVAAMYGFIERGEFFQYQMGWDQDFSRLSIGRLVIRWCIDYTIQRGLVVHDMLPGDYQYKKQWCESSRWLLDLEAHNPRSWKARAFHALRAARRMLPRGPNPPHDPIQS
jgi:CelD/BcsL family acetyltransferase involved in cellulose biosynthesis